MNPLGVRPFDRRWEMSLYSLLDSSFELVLSQGGEDHGVRDVLTYRDLPSMIG